MRRGAIDSSNCMSAIIVLAVFKLCAHKHCDVFYLVGQVTSMQRTLQIVFLVIKMSTNAITARNILSFISIHNVCILYYPPLIHHN